MKKTESGISFKPSAQRSTDASAESVGRRSKGKTGSSVDLATPIRKKIRITKGIVRLMEDARRVGENSSCRRRKVGCVIANIDEINRRNNVVSSSCNCTSWALGETCMKCRRDKALPGEDLDKCPAVHAEVMAAIYAIKVNPFIYRDKVLVTSNMVPCQNCMKVLILADIKMVIVDIPEKYDSLSIELAEKAGIEIYNFEDGRRLV